MRKKGGRPREDLPSGVPANEFAQWIVRSGIAIEAIAKMLGVSISAVYGYRRGNRPPSRVMAGKIENATRGEVKASSWDF